ncbi:MAG: hypothetical protein SNJ67_09155 [Chloracidobacterium sp.]|uniref:Uncharacterized protein n=1 Tax=Chloracidobacterium validum TaxID=2821543 RepID=A0ABX8B7R9_9BACT|nr:hypothetical protein [Chloracidobacterium validum]QUW03009.1 hypothetical protein J8C06_00760 [Chloracidobacterium validum]
MHLCRHVFWASSLLSACLALSSTPGWAQTGAGTPKSVKSRPAKKPAKTPSSTAAETPTPINPNELPLGVQDNLAEAKRLQEQYQREAAARRRAEAEARKKGLPWPPPEEVNPENQSPPAAPASLPASQPAPPPQDTSPPPADPPMESQTGTPRNTSTGENTQPVTEPPPPPAGGKTIIRTWPQAKKPNQSKSPQ